MHSILSVPWNIDCKNVSDFLFPNNTACTVPEPSASKGVTCLLHTRPGKMACWSKLKRLCMKRFWSRIRMFDHSERYNLEIWPLKNVEK
jgi:hypothetical protein